MTADVTGIRFKRYTRYGETKWGFTSIPETEASLRSEINDADYVDKTMLIEMTNQSIGTRNKLTCVSRPRRFGKSYAAKMLAAYYDCSCDSHALFCDKKIAKTDDFEQHINK